MLPEIKATIAAIKAVRNRRYLATERGYHGAFYCALRSEMEQRELLTQNRILEMEYQKSARHGLSQRPDIVFHVPAEISRASVRDNNFAVWALKYSANVTDADEDFRKLNEMCEILRYPLAIFVNIASTTTHLDSYDGGYPERIHSFAVPASNGTELRQSYFKGGKIVEVLHRIP